jgi:hypothetical protein
VVWRNDRHRFLRTDPGTGTCYSPGTCRPQEASFVSRFYAFFFFFAARLLYEWRHPSRSEQGIYHLTVRSRSLYFDRNGAADIDELMREEGVQRYELLRLALGFAVLSGHVCPHVMDLLYLAPEGSTNSRVDA